MRFLPKKHYWMLLVLMGANGISHGDELGSQWNDHLLEQQSIFLLGKGYFNKKDPRQKLALACIEFEDGFCKTAKFVYWKNDVVQYARDEIRVPYTHNEAGIKVFDRKKMKKILTQVFWRVTDMRRETREGRIIGVVAVTAATIMGFFVGMPFFGLGYGVLLMTSDEAPSFDPAKTGLSAGNLTEVTQDRNGWNWSEKPKKLKSKVFNLLLEDLRF